jgi:hypothetical protein
MHPRPDGDFGWIKNRREKPAPREGQNWPGCSLSVLLPPNFEAYAKILHRVTANYQHIDNPYPFTEKEIAILKIPACTEMRSFVETRREKGEGPRIRWKELADFLGVPFEPGICHAWFFANMSETACWSRFLYGPAEGNLDYEELSEIVSILRPFTGDQECFLRFAEIPLIHTDKPLLFAGPLDEVVEFGKENNYQFSPEYVWPSDRNWCVCSDFDCEFTFVGGPRELISAILASNEFEAFQITPQTRIDYHVPMPNPSRKLSRSR